MLWTQYSDNYCAGEHNFHIVTMPFHVILGANHFTIAVYNRMKITVYPCVKWKLAEDMY